MYRFFVTEKVRKVDSSNRPGRVYPGLAIFLFICIFPAISVASYSKGYWVEAEDLKVGDYFVLSDASQAVVEGVDAKSNVGTRGVNEGKKKNSKYNVLEPTYNLEIANTHTYHVGESGVWVHNECPLYHLELQQPDFLRETYMHPMDNYGNLLQFPSEDVEVFIARSKMFRRGHCNRPPEQRTLAVVHKKVGETHYVEAYRMEASDAELVELRRRTEGDKVLLCLNDCLVARFKFTYRIKEKIIIIGNEEVKNPFLPGNSEISGIVTALLKEKYKINPWTEFGLSIDPVVRFLPKGQNFPPL
jgi:hypothetical protein